MNFSDSLVLYFSPCYVVYNLIVSARILVIFHLVSSIIVRIFLRCASCITHKNVHYVFGGGGSFHDCIALLCFIRVDFMVLGM